MSRNKIWKDIKQDPVLGLIVGMIVAFLVITAIGGCGCGKDKAKQGDTRVVKKEVPVCSESTAAARSKFVLQCVAKDTRPEDIGKTDESIQCKKYAEEVYCPLKETEVTQVYYNNKWINLDEQPNYVETDWMGP